MPFVATWMNPQITVLSEINQRKTRQILKCRPKKNVEREVLELRECI